MDEFPQRIRTINGEAVSPGFKLPSAVGEHLCYLHSVDLPSREKLRVLESYFTLVCPVRSWWRLIPVTAWIGIGWSWVDRQL
jgi:hypothetical protein